MSKVNAQNKRIDVGNVYVTALIILETERIRFVYPEYAQNKRSDGRNVTIGPAIRVFCAFTLIMYLGSLSPVSSWKLILKDPQLPPQPGYR